MKKAFFLIEVLISIMLISGVILALFQIKSNNLSFLEKINHNKETDAAMFLIALNNKEEGLKNQKYYVTDVVEFKNDEVRKVFKDISINEKIEKIENKETLGENLTLKMEVYESNYSVDKTTSKFIYRLKLN